MRKAECSNVVATGSVTPPFIATSPDRFPAARRGWAPEHGAADHESTRATDSADQPFVPRGNPQPGQLLPYLSVSSRVSLMWLIAWYRRALGSSRRQSPPHPSHQIAVTHLISKVLALWRFPARANSRSARSSSSRCFFEIREQNSTSLRTLMTGVLNLSQCPFRGCAERLGTVIGA